MSIPELDPETGYLPLGRHKATLLEVESVFAYNFGRRQLFANLSEAVKILYGHGAETIWIDGSFTTSKLRPRDVEVVYRAPAGIDTSQWGDYAPASHDRLKRNRKIDLWPFPSPQPVGLFGHVVDILEFFSVDRDGVPKGLIRLASEGAP